MKEPVVGTRRGWVTDMMSEGERKRRRGTWEKHLVCGDLQSPVKSLTASRDQGVIVSLSHSTLAGTSPGKYGLNANPSTSNGFRGSAVGVCSRLCPLRLGVCKCVLKCLTVASDLQKSSHYFGILLILFCLICITLTFGRRGKIKISKYILFSWLTQTVWDLPRSHSNPQLFSLLKHVGAAMPLLPWKVLFFWSYFNF